MKSDTNDNTERQKRGTRSPNFPVISLPEAIDKIKKIPSNERNIPLSKVAFLKAIGYKGVHGASLSILSALKKYDLINYQGESILLTDNAKVILLAPDSKPDKLAKIRESALKPDIFQKILEKYDNQIPSDETLEYELQYVFKFNEDSAKQFLQVLKDTFSFAKIDSEYLQKGAIDNESGFDKPLKDTSMEAPKQPTQFQDYNLVLLNGKTATLRLPKPYSKEDIDILMKHIDLFKLTLPDETQTEN